MIRQGSPVKIKKKWQDEGDELLTWVAVSDEEKGRVDIMPLDLGLNLPPVQTVKVHMLERH